MKSLWILAAAATFAACAGRGEDDVGAAPDRGDDTTAVKGLTAVIGGGGEWGGGSRRSRPAQPALTSPRGDHHARLPSTTSYRSRLGASEHL